jgi:hypothetical protein
LSLIWTIRWALAAAASKVVLAVHGVASEDVSGHVEFDQQRLHGRNFVGFLIDFDVSERQRRIDSERAEHLFGLRVAAHEGENGKQQYVRQPLESVFGATRIGDCNEQRKKRIQRLQGDLRFIRSPHTDSDFLT